MLFLCKLTDPHRQKETKGHHDALRIVRRRKQTANVVLRGRTPGLSSASPRSCGSGLPGTKTYRTISRAEHGMDAVHRKLFLHQLFFVGEEMFRGQVFRASYAFVFQVRDELVPKDAFVLPRRLRLGPPRRLPEIGFPSPGALKWSFFHRRLWVASGSGSNPPGASFPPSGSCPTIGAISSAWPSFDAPLVVPGGLRMPAAPRASR